MAPTTAAVPAFVGKDIADIVADYEERDDLPIKGEESQMPVDDAEGNECARKYVFDGKAWKYVGTYDCDDNEMVDPELEEADEADQNTTVKTVLKKESSEAETDTTEADVTDVPVVEEKAKKEKKPRAPRAPRAPKAPKATGVTDLQAVLDALDNLKIIEAKDMLKEMIGCGGGDGGAKGKKSKAVVDKADKPKRKPSAYTMFLSVALKKLSETHPDVKNPKERMCLAMVQWREHKATLANAAA